MLMKIIGNALPSVQTLRLALHAPSVPIRGRGYLTTDRSVRRLHSCARQLEMMTSHLLIFIRQTNRSFPPLPTDKMTRF